MIHDDEPTDTYVFFNVTETKFYNVKVRLEFAHHWNTGSSDGLLWLFHETGDVVLFNPFLGDEFQLPSMSSLVTYENTCSVDVLGKIVLSSNPRQSKNFLVAIMYTKDHGPSDTLAFCQYGDKGWTPTQLLSPCYSDIICHNDQIHALSIKRGTIDIWDFLSPFPKKVVEFGDYPEISEILLGQWLPLENQQDDVGITWSANLVKSMGENLIVRQYFLLEEGDSMLTIGFIVYRFDYGKRSWEPIQALPDRAILLGTHSSSISVSTLDCSEFEANSIYYAEGDFFVVYNLEERKINKKQHGKWKIDGFYA
ncbi:hypothetical protein FNV43_RR01339 [Rhamnella rubrinervis]|uniref:KIB1-4 beta-propeller domain-containing protein n=1 Tax=Rhamnella rubrinervis TaxID=2594499 RepID=A0A8K0HQB3_9ROSA|nr:hypothetical protein FNV43_RR01339 [Rhamnella rubrinervis]